MEVQHHEFSSMDKDSIVIMKKNKFFITVAVLSLFISSFVVLNSRLEIKEVVLAHGSKSVSLSKEQYESVKEGRSYLRWDNAPKYKVFLDEEHLGKGFSLDIAGLMDGDYTLFTGGKPSLKLLLNSTTKPRPECDEGSYLKYQPCESWDVRKTILGSPTGIEEVQNRLIDEMSLDRDFEYVCHDAMHYVGIYSLVHNNPNEAVQKAVSICDNGYIHGLIEFLPLVTEDKELASVFATLCEGELPISIVGCYHGLGHGAYLQGGGDLGAGFSYCNLITGKDTFYFTNKTICAAGVSMQYANGNFGEDTQWKLAQMEYCEEIEDREIAYGCASYIFNSLNTSLAEIKSASERCELSPLHYYCWYGLAFTIGYGAMYPFDEGVKLCMSASRDRDKGICYLNLIGQKLDYITKVEELGCSLLGKSYYEFCLEGKKLALRQIPNPT